MITEQRQDQSPPTGQFHSGAAAFIGAGGFNAEALNQVDEALSKLRPQVQAHLIEDAEAHSRWCATILPPRKNNTA
jgi:hypothetical protein